MRIAMRSAFLPPSAEKKPELPPPYRFLTHNRRIREKIENWRTRVRNYQAWPISMKRWRNSTPGTSPAVSSLHESEPALARPGDARNAFASPKPNWPADNLLGYDAEAFPDAVPVSGQPVALAYAYAPGEEHDGVTIELPFTLAQTASPALLEWAVPGLREEMISELLRALPKSIRRELMPFPAQSGRDRRASFSPRRTPSCKTSPPFFTAATASR